MRRIFVSYRRADSEYAAGALCRELRGFFGDEHVFRDKEDISGGVSWRQQVLQEIDRDSALLVLIARNWAQAADPHGRRRLDDSADPVRLEIADGIESGAAVIPVLLEGAEMPSQAELPPDIQPLAEYHALKLRDGDWSHDVGRIFATLEKVGFKAREAPAAEGPRPAPPAAPAAPSKHRGGKLATSYILSGLMLLTGFSDAQDRSTYSGLGIFCLGALALAIFAYRDYMVGKSSIRWPAIGAVALAAVGALALFGKASQAPPARPQLTGGAWTLRRAIDEGGKDWTNSVLQFTSQETTQDGLRLRGTFTWRLDNALMGTENFTGQYEEKTRKIFLVGEAVKDVPHARVERLAVGSYSAILSPGDRELVEGRWGSSPQDAGILGRWEAFR